jgi:hypothetical protein
MGLCPPGKFKLDGGVTCEPSRLQKKLWTWWTEFWDEWVPMVTRGEKYAVIVNGDALDGVHHNAVHQISHNLADQEAIAYRILEPIVERCKGNYYHLRGTEAHVGPSGQNEAMLARRLGAIPDAEGEHARWELWTRLDRALVHITHHIGTTGSMHYETTAVMKELAEAYTEAARWGEEPPDVVIRSHRHRNVEVRIQTRKGFATACTTPAWQLKTPFAYKIPGGRSSRPQIGGTLVRCGDEDAYTRHQVWNLSRGKEEKI